MSYIDLWVYIGIVPKKMPEQIIIFVIFDVSTWSLTFSNWLGKAMQYVPTQCGVGMTIKTCVY